MYKIKHVNTNKCRRDDKKKCKYKQHKCLFTLCTIVKDLHMTKDFSHE